MPTIIGLPGSSGVTAHPSTTPPSLADTTAVVAGYGGSITAQAAVAVGFDPSLNETSLLINGEQASANIAAAVTSITLDRSLTQASTIEVIAEDPARTILNSGICETSQPTEPITVVAATTTTTTTASTTATTTVSPLANGQISPTQLAALQSQLEGQATTSTTVTGTTTSTELSAERYYPTTASLTDGTTTLTFCLVEVELQNNTLTLTFEDQLINQMRQCYSVDGLAVATGTLTRAQVMAQAITKGMPQLQGNVIQPQLIYPAPGTPGIDPIYEATDLTWGGSQNPDQDLWSFLTEAADDAQWRCFSTGTYIVFGPDSWLLSSPVSATFQEFTGSVGYIGFDYDIGQYEADATVNCFNGSQLALAPGAVAETVKLGPASGLWIVSDMTRELHQTDCTVTLAQPQPELTEAQIASTEGTVSTTTGAAVTATNPTGSGGETSEAITAVAYAEHQIGKPYIWGGTGPGGYDCSGLCYAAYKQAGILLPRTSQEMWFDASMPHIPVSQVIPGDLIFYNWDEQPGVPGPGHVVMYIGGGKCVQAPTQGQVVDIIAVWSGAVGAARPSGTT